MRCHGFTSIPSESMSIFTQWLKPRARMKMYIKSKTTLLRICVSNQSHSTKIYPCCAIHRPEPIAQSSHYLSVRVFFIRSTTFLTLVFVLPNDLCQRSLSGLTWAPISLNGPAHVFRANRQKFLAMSEHPYPNSRRQQNDFNISM